MKETELRRKLNTKRVWKNIKWSYKQE